MYAREYNLLRASLTKFDFIVRVMRLAHVNLNGSIISLWTEIVVADGYMPRYISYAFVSVCM